MLAPLPCPRLVPRFREHAVTGNRTSTHPVPSFAERGSAWRLRILDGFALLGAAGDVPLQPAAQRLLALLAVHHGSAERVYVAGTLWLDTSDGKASANLRSLLWRLRRSCEGLVDATHMQVSLADEVEVDLERSRGRARSAIRGERPPQPDDIEALTGDLLPDWYDDWVIIERERLRQGRLHALEALCAQFASRRQFALALDAGLEAVSAEPLRESAHRAVMAVHIAEGNQTEAVRHYREYVRLLDAEMGLRPSEHMRELVSSLMPV